MMASRSLPVGVSSACSVMETTRTPLRLSMDERQSTRKIAVLVGGGLGSNLTASV